MYNLFVKLTSCKPEIREQPNLYINSTVGMDPCWYYINCPIYKRYFIRKSILKYSHIIEIKNHIQHSNYRRIIYTRGNDSTLTYTFKPWIPFTERSRLHLLYCLNVNRTPLLDTLDQRKPGLGDLFRESVRIKKFQLLDCILYSYWRDNRFIIFISLFIGFTIFSISSPDQLWYNPVALSSPDLPFLNKVLMDTYEYNVCTTHPEVSSPCDCGEPINMTARNLFETYDPLNCYKTTRIKAASFMVGYIILSIALSESVSQYGVYMNLN